MKTFLTLFFLLFAMQLQAQTISVTGKVTDSETGMPISEAFVSIPLNGMAVYTDSTGKYSIRINGGASEVTLRCEATNYLTRESVVKLNGRNKTVNFELVFSAVVLPSVNITTGPQTVWRSSSLHVVDYAFVTDGMLLLTGEKEERWKREEDSKTTLFNGCRLILTDSLNREKTRVLIPELCKGFVVNFFGDVFLMTHKKIYIVVIENDLISLGEIPNEFYEKEIEPVIDSIHTNVYLSNYNKNFPAFEYLVYSGNDSLTKPFRYLVDEELMKIFRSEYKYMQPREKLEAFRFELQTGIDKEIIAAYMRGFQNTYYYEPLNIPLYIRHDTLLMFDHHHNKMIRYNREGIPVDSIEISYHKNTNPYKWSGKITQDTGSSDLYTTFEKDGIYFVKKLNIKTGKCEDSFRVTYKYAEKFSVHNGYVYYTYRPFESTQKKYLYREKILTEGQ